MALVTYEKIRYAPKLMRTENGGDNQAIADDDENVYESQNG